MIIDKSKLQPLLWAVVGAWKAGDQDLHLRTDALDAFLGETTVEEVALGLLAEIDRLIPFEEAYATACHVRNRLIRENEVLRKDAERYRAIRDEIPHVDLGRAILDVQSADEYDAAVDAVMAKEASHG